MGFRARDAAPVGCVLGVMYREHHKRDVVVQMQNPNTWKLKLVNQTIKVFFRTRSSRPAWATDDLVLKKIIKVKFSPFP